MKNELDVDNIIKAPLRILKYLLYTKLESHIPTHNLLPLCIRWLLVRMYAYVPSQFKVFAYCLKYAKLPIPLAFLFAIKMTAQQVVDSERTVPK
jgi:hypothetical protein